MGTHVIRVDDALWARLQAAADTERRPISQWARLVLEDKLASLDQPGGIVPAGTTAASQHRQVRLAAAEQRQVQTNFKKS